MQLTGFQIISNPMMADTRREWFRRPRTKRRRIVKKWRKNPRNWRSWSEPWGTVYRVGNQIIAHPSVVQKMQKAWQQQQKGGE